MAGRLPSSGACAVLLSVAFGALLVGAQAPPQQQTPPPPPPPAAKNGQNPGSAQPPSNPPEAAQKPAKPRKVYTNDDLDGRGSVYANSVADAVSYEDLYGCDRNCFNDIARMGHFSAAGARWKLALLDAIDRVKADPGWQGLLRELIRVKYDFCGLQLEKARALRDAADPQNVTPKELAIEAEYDRKFKQLEAKQTEVYNRGDAYIAKHSTDALESQFMNWQRLRVVQARCVYRTSPSEEPRSDPDDPEDPDDP